MIGLTLRVAVSFSGGKDSTYATWIAMHQAWDVRLVTVRPSSADSLMFHHPNIEWTGLQAEAMGLSQEIVEMKGNGELVDLQHTLDRMKSEDKISGLVTGAVASDYQKTRFDNMCDAIGLKTYDQLWHKSLRLLVETILKSRFGIVLSAVEIKVEQLSKIHGIHLTGEGGEYESFVLDAPHFSKTIQIERSQNEWHGDSGSMTIEKASLGNKLGN